MHERAIPRLACVISRFNEPVTQALWEGAQASWARHSSEALEAIWVPGAVELPCLVQCLAARDDLDVIVALGAVIRGETPHFDYVCSQVAFGCQRVALDARKPVIFGVLTVDNAQQAWDRLGGFHGHKGEEAIETAIETHRALLRCQAV